MNYNIDHWKSYYSTIRQSSFAEYCLPFISGSLLDVCCGNGRDADYFYQKGIDVMAFDIIEMDKPYNYKSIDLGDNIEKFSFSSVDNVYCRFVLHAVPEHLEDYILIESNKILPVGGTLFIEARSDKGEHDGLHYRRLINIDTLLFKLMNIGFEITESTEERGYSIAHDNPELIRIIAKKTKEIETTGPTWEEFYTKKQIDQYSSSHLLLSVKKILYDIPFYLSFGTLLGAYREGGFIKHDTDVDVVLLDYSYNNIKRLCDRGYFALYGLTVVRHNPCIYSFAYKKDYIDLYFFQKKGMDYWLGRSYSIKSYQIENTPSMINFIGEEFMTFHNIEEYLIDLYGKDWRIPL